MGPVLTPVALLLTINSLHARQGAGIAVKMSVQYDF
jgi:hypothetical protein